MEVICFGLTLPLSEHDTLKDSVNLYLDWMTVLTTQKPGIPLPIQREPLPYVQKMICHLQNLFILRYNQHFETKFAYTLIFALLCCNLKNY